MSPEPTVASADASVLRCFVAIQLPAQVRAALCEVQADLRPLFHGCSISWTRAENLHLTLRFLGDVPVARLDDLKSSLRASLTGFGKPDLLCERLGCFPDGRFPRVVWAAVRDAKERLPELHRQVDVAVREFCNRPAEARFVGHVTLARPRQIKRADAERLARFLEGVANRQFGTWRGTEVELMASALSPGGSRYTTLDVLPL